MTGLPRSSGSVALLDRGEERVEVDVEDRPLGHGPHHRARACQLVDAMTVGGSRVPGWRLAPSLREALFLFVVLRASLSVYALERDLFPGTATVFPQRRG